MLIKIQVTLVGLPTSNPSNWTFVVNWPSVPQREIRRNERGSQCWLIVMLLSMFLSIDAFLRLLREQPEWHNEHKPTIRQLSRYGRDIKCVTSKHITWSQHTAEHIHTHMCACVCERQTILDDCMFFTRFLAGGQLNLQPYMFLCPAGNTVL